ncbi:MAG: hypothetical protein Q8R92_14840 [Deltaproteobacteria bacterium]|nr:hypothetical protein [Deltaproteobacteria bacterium]
MSATLESCPTCARGLQLDGPWETDALCICPGCHAQLICKPAFAPISEELRPVVEERRRRVVR